MEYSRKSETLHTSWIVSLANKVKQNELDHLMEKWFARDAFRQQMVTNAKIRSCSKDSKEWEIWKISWIMTNVWHKGKQDSRIAKQQHATTTNPIIDPQWNIKCGTMQHFENLRKEKEHLGT